MKFPHRNLSIHDVHLAHSRVPTEFTIDNLNKEITKERLEKIDILYFPGDFMDTLLLQSDESIPAINLWVIELAEKCYSTNTALRFLEGTPSHDGKQFKNIDVVIKKLFPNLDYRYITDMEIEYISKFDIHVMYVPDEWASRDVMYLTAKSLLKEHGLDKVDFIIGHNQFKFQYLPHIRPKVDALNEEDWCDMIRYHGYFGHIHRRGSYKQIEVAGSFDRLAHGEEQPKGYLEGYYNSEEDYGVIFHENKNAAIFKTIRLKAGFNPSSEEDMKELIRETEQPENRQTHIRYIYPPGTPISDIIVFMKVRFPMYRFTASANEESAQKLDVALPDEVDYPVIDINRDNIVRLFEEQFTDVTPYQKEMVDLLNHYIEQVK